MAKKDNSLAIENLIGRKIYGLRKSRGYSQEALAEKSGINSSFLGCIERGQKCPTLRVVEKIRQALEVTYSELFDFSPVRERGEESRLQERFFRLLKELDSPDLILLDDMLGVFLHRMGKGEGEPDGLEVSYEESI